VTADAAFPAPLQDVLAGYLYLIDLGFEPLNISLIGDSSGAHLVLGLSRYLAEINSKETDLGMPGALLLISVNLFASSSWTAYTDGRCSPRQTCPTRLFSPSQRTSWFRT
jgi:acetyl esterase/lipase